MKWFKNMVSDSAAKLVDSVAGGLDSLFTSDEERLKARAIIEKQTQDHTLQILEAHNKFEGEITARWKSDNEHLITRLVRPVAFLSVLFIFFVITFADGNIGEFAINEKYIPVYELLLSIMVVAYFGSRGAEKIVKTVNQGKGKAKAERWE